LGRPGRSSLDGLPAPAYAQPRSTGTIARGGAVSKRKTRSTFSYLAAAKHLQKLAPSLRKYRRRLKLNRWEKGAITRKEKILAHYANRTVVALTRRQARNLKDKDAIIGGGIRAVALNRIREGATVRVIKGELVIRSNGRTLHHIKTGADFDRITGEAELIMRRAEKRGKIATVWLRNPQGRFGDPFRDTVHLAAAIAALVEAYTDVEDESPPEDWLLGIEYLEE